MKPGGATTTSATPGGVPSSRAAHRRSRIGARAHDRAPAGAPRSSRSRRARRGPAARSRPPAGGGSRRRRVKRRVGDRALDRCVDRRRAARRGCPLTVRGPAAAPAPGRGRSSRRPRASAATSSRAPVGARPMSSQWSISVPASRARRRISRTTAGDPGPLPVDEVHADLRVGPLARILEKQAHRLDRRQSARRFADRLRDHFATPMSSVARLTLNAMSGLRAPTATAPPRGCMRGGQSRGRGPG